MKRAVLLLLLFCVHGVSFGQSSKLAIYRTHITTHQGLKVTGLLTYVGHSTLQMIPLTQLRGIGIGPDQITGTYAVKDIYALCILKKGAAGRAALLGGGTGLVLGAITGYASYSPCESSGATGAWFGCFDILDQSNSAIIGGVTGTI